MIEACGNFGARAEAAVLRVEGIQRGLHHQGDDARIEVAAVPGETFGVGERSHEAVGFTQNVVAPLFVSVGDGQQDLGETRAPVGIDGREVGSAIEGLAFTGEEGGEGPSALAGDGGNGGLVAAVDVGTLVAIDLDSR